MKDCAPFRPEDIQRLERWREAEPGERLWALARLSNIDKHQTLHTVVKNLLETEEGPYYAGTGLFRMPDGVVVEVPSISGDAVFPSVTLTHAFDAPDEPSYHRHAVVPLLATIAATIATVLDDFADVFPDTE